MLNESQKVWIFRIPQSLQFTDPIEWIHLIIKRQSKCRQILIIERHHRRLKCRQITEHRHRSKYRRFHIIERCRQSKRHQIYIMVLRLRLKCRRLKCRQSKWQTTRLEQAQSLECVSTNQGKKIVHF